MGTLTFILVLSVLVFIHELGHFSVARYYGVKVYDFSIGFGPKLITKHFAGTNWSISLIPLGGYVRMKGQEDLDPSKQSSDSDSYNILSPFKRIMILLAGPGANFLLAFVLYFAVSMMEHKQLGTTIGKIIPNSPAFKSGLMVNDKILKINNQDIKIWKDLSTAIIDSNGPMKFYVKREGKIKTFVINPKVSDSKNIFKEDIKKRMIGISPALEIVVVSYGIPQSFSIAFERTVQSSKLIFQGIQKLLQGIVPSSEIGGVVSIGKVISDASQNGIVSILLIAALISVNLGVLNLLPIPALDGGHIMFNLYEIIAKRKPSTKVLMQLTIIGWVMLLSLMILGLYNDFNRFF